MRSSPLVGQLSRWIHPTEAAVRAVAPRGWIRAQDPAGFSARRICAIRHDYHRHPQLQLPALAELAGALAARGQCRFLRPGTTQDSPLDQALQDGDGRRIDEVIRGLAQPRAWLALYNIEVIASYRDLLAEILESARPLYEREQHGLFGIGGYIFISAPPAVTPFHIDRENNFWLQLRGRKTISVWDHRDRDVVPAAAVERFIVNRSLGAVRLLEPYRARGIEFDAGPGDGVYFPSTSPHMTRTDTGWVSSGDGLSVSIGVVFHSRETRRDAQVHNLNEFLRRRLHVEPRSPGQSAVVDALKAALAQGLIAARRRLRGHAAPPGIG